MKSIFVSSTFKDMQFERDFMQVDIIPQLNKFAMEYGEQLRFVDLRWGVNTSDLESDEGANKVLSVCLDEIDNCNPYMIVILGERYGWVPDKKHLHYCTQSKNYEIDDYMKSVTALEIEYGALSEKSKPENCLFFIRDSSFIDDMPQDERAIYESENAEHLAKLNSLKKRLTDNFSDRVFYYSPKWDSEKKRLEMPENFKEEMINGVKKLMQEDFDRIANLHVIERDEILANLYLEEKQKQYATRFELAENIANKIIYDDEFIFIVKGITGSGKSCLLAQVLKNLTDENIQVNKFVAQTGTQTGDVFSLVKHFIYNIEKIFGIDFTEHTDYEMAKDYFWYLMELYAKHDMPLQVFVIDNINKFDDASEIRRFMLFPPNHPSEYKANIKFIFTQHSQVEYSVPVNKREFTHETEVQMLTDTEKVEVINGILAAAGKELDDDVIERIVKKSSSELPLYIYLIVQRLLIFDIDDFNEISKMGNDMEAISKYMCKIVDTSSGVIDPLFTQFLFDVSDKIEEDSSLNILTLMTCSIRGLRQSDIEAIFQRNEMPYSAIDLSRFLLYLGRFITTGKDGQIDFTYKEFATDLQARFEEKGILEIGVNAIFEHFKELDLYDPLRMKNILSYANVMDDYKFIVEYIATVIDSKDEELLDITMKDFEENHFWGESENEYPKKLMEAAIENSYVLHLIEIYRQLLNKMQASTNTRENNFIFNTVLYLFDTIEELGYLDLEEDDPIYTTTEQQTVDLYRILLYAASEVDDISQEQIEKINNKEIIDKYTSQLNSDKDSESYWAVHFLKSLTNFYVRINNFDDAIKYLDILVKHLASEYTKNKEVEYACMALERTCMVFKIYNDNLMNTDYEAAEKHLLSALEFSESLKVDGEMPAEYQETMLVLYQAFVTLYEKYGKIEELHKYCDMCIELALKINAELNNAASINALAMVYLCKGTGFYLKEEYEDAIECFISARSYQEEILKMNLSAFDLIYVAECDDELVNSYKHLDNDEKLIFYSEDSIKNNLEYYENIENSFYVHHNVLNAAYKAIEFFYDKKNYEQSFVWVKKYVEYFDRFIKEYDCTIHEDFTYVPYGVISDMLETIKKERKNIKAHGVQKLLDKEKKLKQVRGVQKLLDKCKKLSDEKYKSYQKFIAKSKA